MPQLRCGIGCPCNQLSVGDDRSAQPCAYRNQGKRVQPARRTQRRGDGLALHEGRDGARHLGRDLRFLPVVRGGLARPRAGLIRVREFTMKDGYSFHTSQECLEAYYERAHEAELWRIRGELLCARGRSAAGDVRSCFDRSLQISIRQKAKGWELRTATSYARWLSDSGDAAAARKLLAPVYNWFTEGFDTADLREAKALLDALT